MNSATKGSRLGFLGDQNPPSFTSSSQFFPKLPVKVFGSLSFMGIPLAQRGRAGKETLSKLRRVYSGSENLCRM